MSSSSPERHKFLRRKGKQHLIDGGNPSCRSRPKFTKECYRSCKKIHRSSSRSSSKSRGRSSSSSRRSRSHSRSPTSESSRSGSGSSSDISHRLSHRMRKSNTRLCYCSRCRVRRKQTNRVRKSERAACSSSSDWSDGEKSSSSHRLRKRRRKPTIRDETDYLINKPASLKRRHRRRRSSPCLDKKCRHSLTHSHPHDYTNKRTPISSQNFHKRSKERKRREAEYSSRKKLKISNISKDLAYPDSRNKLKMHHLHQPFYADGLSSKSTFYERHPFHPSPTENHYKEMFFEEIMGRNSAVSSLKDSKSTECGTVERYGDFGPDGSGRIGILNVNDCSQEKSETKNGLGTSPMLLFEEQQKESYRDWLSLSLETPEDPLPFTAMPVSREIPPVDVIAVSSEDDVIPCPKISCELSSSMDASYEQHSVGESFPPELLSFEESRYYQLHAPFSKDPYTQLLSNEDEMIECGKDVVDFCDEKPFALASIGPTSSRSSKASRKQADIQMTNSDNERILDALPLRVPFSLQESELQLTKFATDTAAPVQSSVYYEQDSSGDIRLVTHLFCELKNESSCAHVLEDLEAQTSRALVSTSGPNGKELSVNNMEYIVEQSRPLQVLETCLENVPEFGMIGSGSKERAGDVETKEELPLKTVRDGHEFIPLVPKDEEDINIDVENMDATEATTWPKKGKMSRKNRSRDARNSDAYGGHVPLESYYSQGPDDTNIMSNVPFAPIEISTSDAKEEDTAGCRSSNRRTLAELIEAQTALLVGKKNKWEKGVCCDLCGQGPSLSLGEWYAWCCGARWVKCVCSKERQLKVKKEVHSKARGVLAKQDITFLSGAVHRMCALWSSEVYEEDDPGDRLVDVYKAVKRGVALQCADPDCRSFGATLGCRIKQCRRSFHYPCADKLASKFRLRMWEGKSVPVVCFEHLHLDLYGGKEKTDIGGSRGKSDNFSSKNSFFQDKLPSTHVGPLFGKSQKSGDGKKTVRKLCNLATPSYFGNNLLCEDISAGKEVAKIPCTNDVDCEPFPSIHYITENRCVGQASELLQGMQKNKTKLARSCNGCHQDMENPDASIPVHIFSHYKSREDDLRFDWQGQPMHARLPYDCYGRLQLGLYSSDILECNSRCTCGPTCCNKELQKGLQFALEVFKTEDRGWGVRTLEDIPRGRFVVEYIGEILTQAEGDKRAEQHELTSYNYPVTVDCLLESSEKSPFVINGFKYSNVARFINTSCEANLKIYRVYTEILDMKLFRVGMYAIKDIRSGEELSYNLKFGQVDPTSPLNRV